jgi:hypothetical protein
MKTLKHIGRMKNTGARVLVVFRTLPGESNNALVLPVSNLADSYHDALMQLVESDQAQETNEFGEIMHIRQFPDGRPMLLAMTQDNRLQKVATDLVVMTPTHDSEIQLDQLNVLIAEQRNCAVDDLSSFVSGAPKEKPEVKTQVVEPEAVEVKDTTPLSDKDLARSYRSQADAMYKEAAKLRREADLLDPPQKKAAKEPEQVGA